MKWLNSLKKGFKYVLLALCCLALVFQPLTSYASDLVYDPSTLGKFVYILEGDSAYPNNFMSQSDLAMFYDILDYFVGSYPYLSAAAGDIDNATNMIYYKTSSYYYIVAPNPNLGNMQLYMNPSGSIYTVYNGSTIGTPVINFQYRISTQAFSTTTRNTLNSTSTPYFITSDITMNDGRPIFITASSGTPSDYPDIPDLSGVNTISPNTLYIPLFQSVFETYAHKLYSEFPSYVAGSNDDGTLIYKTYETGALWYLIMTNTGIMETYFNHQYGFFNNISANLASFANNQNEISEYVSSVIPSVEQIESELSDINYKLDMAFPGNQAEMNDSIAEQVLDDSNGKGLTISKITSTKSLLDEGVDTFEVDSSGITWSNPFSALLYLDWAWFSETTALNLQVQEQGSLQSDIDLGIDYSGLQYYNSVNSYYDDGH